MDQNAKSQVIERIKEAQNILVTVSNDPTIDQLASTIGLTLLLNKLDKRATAVFSGSVPSTLEFLKPEETLEQNTDSLRDFIISLDKSKADKLRYKVEDDIVRIFITPYRTKIGQDDLVFSQGDFNIDLVIALGVDNREHIDNAIIAHGRILHDASVVALSTKQEPIDMGNLNWQSPNSSSLCEMVVEISEKLREDGLDNQIATALLTGIVSETDRFKNERTTPKSMTISAKLMAAGANQQLVVNELSRPIIENQDGEDDSEQTVAGGENDEDQGIIELHHQKEEIEDHHINIDDDTGRFSNAEELRDSEENNNADVSSVHKTIEPLTEEPIALPSAEEVIASQGHELDLHEETPNTPLPGQEISPTNAPDQEGQQNEEELPSNDEVPKEFPKIIRQKGSLDHDYVKQPGQDNGAEFVDSEADAESDLPSIDQGQQMYSKFIDAPPLFETPPLNGVREEAENDGGISIDTTAGLPVVEKEPDVNAQESTTSPLLSISDDAESPSATSIPSTPSSLLADDGESDTSERPLGPVVSSDETLAEIEDSVSSFEGVSNAPVSDNDAPLEANVVESAEEAARKAVFDAIAQQDQPYFPEPNQNIGAQFVPLDSDPKKESVSSTQPLPESPQPQDEPPSMPPPIFPFSNQ